MIYGRDDATDAGDWGDVFRGQDKVPKPVLLFIRAFLKCLRDDLVTRSRDLKLQDEVREWLARTDDDPLSPRWIESVLRRDVRPLVQRLRRGNL